MTWPTVKLGDICTFTYGKSLSQAFRDGGNCAVYGSNGIVGSHSESLSSGETIVIGRKGSIGEINWSSGSCWPIDTTYYVDKNSSKQNLRWLYWRLRTLGLTSMNKSAAVPGLNREDAYRLETKLPPLAEQQRIAAILDKAEEIRRKRELAIAKLDELAQSTFVETLNDKTNKKIKIQDLIIKKRVLPNESKTVWSLSLEQIQSDTGKIIDEVYVEKHRLGTSTFYFEPPVILYSKLRPYLNKVVMPNKCGYATTELIPLYCNDEILRPSFLVNYLRSKLFVDYANTNSGGAKMPRVMMDKFWEHEVSVPSMVNQLKFERFYIALSSNKRVHEAELKKTNQLLASLQHQAFTTGFGA